MCVFTGRGEPPRGALGKPKLTIGRQLCGGYVAGVFLPTHRCFVWFYVCNSIRHFRGIPARVRSVTFYPIRSPLRETLGILLTSRLGQHPLPACANGPSSCSGEVFFDYACFPATNVSPLAFRTCQPEANTVILVSYGAGTLLGEFRFCFLFRHFRV